MPELPEVETVCRELREKLQAQPQVTQVKMHRYDLRVEVPKNIARALKGQAIHSVRRRAKYLLFDTEEYTVLSHLGMSGSWRVESPATKISRKKHDHCAITLNDGQSLIFHDPRRFGLIDLLPLKQEHLSPWLSHLGPEPFDAQVSGAYLALKAKGKNPPVKNFIMDQTVIVGVGNIYASEALFLARVKPARRVSKVTLAEWVAIVAAIQRVLGTAIEHGGTTLRDYRKTSGEWGDHQNHLHMYNRAGEPCPHCQKKIHSKVISARSTFWCNSCQK